MPRGDGIVVTSKRTRTDEEVTVAFRDLEVDRNALHRSPAWTCWLDGAATRAGRARRHRDLREFEAPARERMTGPNFDYLAGGWWDEITLPENDAAWREFRFVYRVLTDIRSVDAGGSFLGRPSALPIAIAPMAAQAMAHPDAEGAMTRAAAGAGIPMILSTSASMSPRRSRTPHLVRTGCSSSTCSGTSRTRGRSWSAPSSRVPRDRPDGGPAGPRLP